MSYYPPPPPVDRDVHGVLVGIEPRTNGWVRVLIAEPGRQYPLKADTKKPELIGQVQAMMGQPVSAQVREQESENINPNSGRPYTNRYLNAIAMQGALGFPQGDGGSYTPPPYAPQPPQFPPPPPVQQQYPAAPPQPPQGLEQPPQPPIRPQIMGYDKDINIMRQTAAKVVAMSWQILPEQQRTTEGLIMYAEAWMAYFVYGPLRFGVQAFTAPEQPVDGNGQPVAHVVPTPGTPIPELPADAPQWEKDYWANRAAAAADGDPGPEPRPLPDVPF